MEEMTWREMYLVFMREHICVLVNYIVVLFLWFAVPLSLLKLIRSFSSNLI